MHHFIVADRKGEADKLKKKVMKNASAPGIVPYLRDSGHTGTWK